MSDNSTPWWMLALGLVFAVGIFWWMSQPERYDECRERCADKGYASWAYDPVRGTCGCGGSAR